MAITFENKTCALCDNDSKFVELVVCRDLRIDQDVRTVVCGNCGLVFLNPGPDEGAYLDFYSHTMGRTSKEPEKQRIIRKKKVLGPLFLRFISDCVGDTSNMDAVDVGSGWGGFLHYLKPCVKSLQSIEMFGPAKKYIEREFGCIVHSVPRLRDAFPNGSLDMITSTAVIEHYPDPVSAAMDYYDALKPGGVVFIYTSNVKEMCFKNGVNQYFKFVHPYYYSINTLRSLLSKVGFVDFRCWTSKPTYSARSLQYPGNLMSGSLMMIARKGEKPLRDDLPVIRDDPHDIIVAFHEACEIDAAFQAKLKLWSNPLAFPFRLLARLIWRVPPDPNVAMAAQYDGAGSLI